MEHVDVLVVGAGLSGIGAACRLSVEHPRRSVAVLEAREASGGTWDLFRYPGIRSDSDMFTFGYRWRPWGGEQTLVEGPRILEYLRTVAREYDVERLIRYRHRVLAASWDSATARWTVDVDHDGERRTMTADFLWGCTGYYDTERGHTPELPGIERFGGRVVHPQHWPGDLDHTGMRVVVIGSGATAVTLVPAMAGTAEHVTMLQRSPSYVLSLPAVDPLARRLSWLPESWRHRVVRGKAILAAQLGYRLSRSRPALVRRLVRRLTARELPEGFDVDTHFKPVYDPWDQRMCFVPDGDLFRAIRRGDAGVVTGTIETFTPTGVRLASGEELAADLVVTATGLELKPFGGIRVCVDGEEVDPAQRMAYRAAMLAGVPNFVFTIGYANATWTLKADLVADWVCRLLAHLDAHGHRVVVPEPDPTVEPVPFLPLTSGYIQRAAHLLPRQGDRAPWRLAQNYLADRRTMRCEPIDDGVLAFR
ncbi:flavin-containing monooxygenase [Nocardioides sp. GCM10027113]|uniref:flavin-containing monooxygenase n=1 Tax=unclassified Nocardioides TaxID=2615069 RepID=UPI00362334E0